MLQIIPIHLLHGLLPAHDEIIDWLRLSKLAFHTNRAFACSDTGGTPEEALSCEVHASKKRLVNARINECFLAILLIGIILDILQYTVTGNTNF